MDEGASSLYPPSCSPLSFCCNGRRLLPYPVAFGGMKTRSHLRFMCNTLGPIEGVLSMKTVKKRNKGRQNLSY